MSNTYTGNVLLSPVAFASQPAQAFPDDLQGTVVELDSLPGGVSGDNIFYYNSPTTGKYLKRVVDGPYRAVWAGISSANSAATNSSRLSTLFARSDIKEILFDEPTGAVISCDGTTLNANNKILSFTRANYLSGTFILQNAKLHGSITEKILDNTITLEGARTASLPFVSVNWFGAVGDDSTDDIISIQRAVDSVIRNDSLPRDVYFVPGYNYVISSPIICAFFRQGQPYRPCTVMLRGGYGGITKFPSISANVPRITLTVKDQFAVGFHLCKSGGCESLQIRGQYSVPNKTILEFYTANFETYGDSTCRDIPVYDARYSPYSGIVIDPFKPVSTPPDDGYPRLTNFYTGATVQEGSDGTGGSSGLTFKDLFIEKFTMGITLAPNGHTLNCESMNFEDIQFQDLKCCYVTCQDQIKQVTIKNNICWGTVHTFLVNNGYGLGLPSTVWIDGLDIAGKVCRLFYMIGGGRYPSYVANVFAESLGTIGDITSHLTQTIRDSIIEFYPSVQVNYHGLFERVCLDNVSLRKYGTFHPLRFKGAYTEFKNCYFEVEPLTEKVINSVGGGVIFNRCYNGSSGGVIGASGSYTYSQAINRYMSIIGNFSLSEFNQQGIVDYLLKYNNEKYRQLGVYITTASISPDLTTREATIDVGSFPIDALNVGDWLTNGYGVNTMFLGRIKSKNVGANDIDIDLIPMEITAGTYGVYIFKSRKVLSIIRGTPKAGTNKLEKCKVYGQNPLAGDVYDAKCPVAVAGNAFSANCFMITKYTLSSDPTTGNVAEIDGVFPNWVSGRYTFYNGNPVHELFVHDKDRFPIADMTQGYFVLTGSKLMSAYSHNKGYYVALTDGWLSNLSGGLTSDDVARLLWKPVKQVELVNATNPAWDCLESDTYNVDASGGNLSFTFYDHTIGTGVSGYSWYDVSLRGRTIKFIRIDTSTNTVTFNAGANNTINGIVSFVMTGIVTVLFFGDNGQITVIN